MLLVATQLSFAPQHNLCNAQNYLHYLFDVVCADWSFVVTTDSFAMRYLHSSEYVKVPQGVSVEVHSRNIRVKGPRGILVKDLTHVNMEVSPTLFPLYVDIYCVLC